MDSPRLTQGDGILPGITSENDEVSVYFDGWHDHYGSWTGASEDEAFCAALASIAVILGDELLAVLVKKDGRWKWSTAIAPGEAIDIKEGETAHVTSWSSKVERVVTWCGDGLG